MKKIKLKYSILSLAILLFACNEEGGQTSEETQDSTTTTSNISKAGKVFYSIPSPLQMATLLKSTGASYDEGLPNASANLSKYTTTAERALNLGVYGTDMSLASIFDQSQETLKFLKCVSTLGKDIGISQAFNDNVAKRIEANTSNRDSLLQIISEAYWDADARLKEEQRAGVSALIIAGGWIEGLYLATEIAKTSGNNEILVRIAEQKLSLNNLIGLLGTYPEDEQLNAIKSDLEGLKTVFEMVEINLGKAVIETDPASKVTTISGSGTVSAVTEVQLLEISNKIAYIRNNIIKQQP